MEKCKLKTMENKETVTQLQPDDVQGGGGFCCVW